MKNYAFIMILLTIGILSCGSKKKPVTGWNYDDPQETAYYSLKIPDKSNMKDDRQRKIAWEKDKKYHYLEFGTFTTETTWKIYDWLGYHGSDSQLPPPLVEEKFPAEKATSINISSLGMGKYMVSFTAIAEGCNFELTIE